MKIGTMEISKKYSALIVGFLMVLLQDVIGLSPDAAQELLNLFMVYIGGQSAVDIGKAMKKKA